MGRPTTFSKLFLDQNNRVVIWQKPNVFLSFWIVLKLSPLAFTSLKRDVNQLASVVLIAWAIMEITSGASLFRRILGAVVLVLSLKSLV